MSSALRGSIASQFKARVAPACPYAREHLRADATHPLECEPMERRSFNEGETIFREGDASDCAFQIVVGSVNVHLPNGRVRHLGPGEIFGEMGLVDSRPRSATVTAAEYSVFATYS